MIRRWSCINHINMQLSVIQYLSVRYKLKTFRSSVNFKKYYLINTKFKRKSFVRIKHKTNFLPYLNILKYWIPDFYFCKHYFKFQFFNKFFFKNFLFINLFSNKNRLFFESSNFLFSTWVKKSYNYFSKYNLLLVKRQRLDFAWYINDSSNLTVIPKIYNTDDSKLTIISKITNNFLFSDLQTVLLNVVLKKVLILKQIITILLLNFMLNIFVFRFIWI